MTLYTVSNNKRELPWKFRGSFSNSSRLYWGCVAVMASLYALLSALTPMSLDDWMFMSVWRDDAANDGFSFPGWWRYYVYIRGYDNGRIANALSPLSTMISPWREVFPVFTGALLALSAVMVQRFAVRSRSLFSLALVWLLMIVALPWRDTIFVRDYSLNYIWASAATLGFLWLLRKGESTGWSPAIFISTLFWAPIAGGWHESFAIPTLCALGIIILRRRFRLSSRFYIIVTLYLAAAFIFMMSPGMMGRIGNELSGSFGRGSWRNYIILIIDFFLTVGLLFSNSGRRTLLNICSSDTALGAVTIIITGVAIAVLTVHTARSFFWPDLAAVTLCVWLVGEYAGTSGPRSSRMMWATGLILILCIAQTLSVIVWQWRYSKENNEIITLLDKSPSGTVFYDSRLPERPPFYTLGIPVSNSWRNPYNYRNLWHYYMTPTLGVVPTDLRSVSLRSGVEVSGIEGARLINGHLVAPFEKLDTTTRMVVPVYRQVNVSLPDGKVIDGPVVAYPFVTARGDTLLYYR